MVHPASPRCDSGHLHRFPGGAAGLQQRHSSDNVHLVTSILGNLQ
ncbi:hypothetical protein E2C01_044728 [Portunus trituberculatus]|uniref:Uncharacterized protein n=1 Tax=Portunus trituberculatus TaxID=210409 RepID=A0A5B7G328_PORTR|nr:hypothetical protein [Portunus trituberculatus]